MNEVGIVDYIDCVYESMSINTSIVVCNSCEDINKLYDEFNTRSYPCLLTSTNIEEKMDRLPNKMFLCSSQEYMASSFAHLLSNTDIDCIFFVGFQSFSKCVNKICTVGKKDRIGIQGVQDKQYIFTLPL